jgi:Fuc2NAc and GlcNAc transferase
MNSLWLVPLALISAFVLTALLRKYALARSVMDIPNARSSHTVPTPRGGGVAIVLSMLLLMPLLYDQGAVTLPILAACVGSGGLIAVIGFMDDHGHIAPLWRLVGHFLAAIWALGWLGHFSEAKVLGLDIIVGWGGYLLTALFLVWMLNLYNFMDGIDGIASVQAITATLSACLIYVWSDQVELIWPALLLAAATAGFLCWNFPPAKIFMGDAGSGFIGIILGILAVQAGWAKPEFFCAWLILMGVFIVDATLTLFCRLLRGEKVVDAHRSHAYQHASRMYKRHLPVTLAVLAINVIWLLPIAIGVAIYSWDSWLMVILAYIPLVVIAVKYRAGQKETAPVQAI